MKRYRSKLLFYVVQSVYCFIFASFRPTKINDDLKLTRKFERINVYAGGGGGGGEKSRKL